MKLPPAEPDGDGPNLTPVIDIVFLLLIFFLVATRFDQEEKDISVNIPEVADAQPLTMGPRDIVINILKDGKYKVGNMIMTEPALGQYLKKSAKENPTQRVQLRVDERAPFRYPASAVGLCRSVGLKHACRVTEHQ
jgi:biopolymer transport protein ExbD